MLWLDNQEVNEQIEPVEIVGNEDLNVISTDLKELLKFLKNEKIEQQEIAEAEKQIQLETDNQQIELDEQNKIKNLEQDQKDLEKEQSLIDSENEFRTNLIDSVNLQGEKMDTYIQKSDGLLASVNSMNENTELLIQNTAIEDTADIDNMSYYADLTLVMITWVFLPLYVSYRMIKPMFNKIF